MNLHFPVDRKWPDGSSFIGRWAARIVVKRLLTPARTSYQCSCNVWGKNVGNVGQCVMQAQVPGTQIAHWVLRTAGYNVSVADVMERVGLDASARYPIEEVEE